MTIYILILISLSILLWAVYSLKSFFYGAPWLPTSNKAIKKMHHLAKFKKTDNFYDLGSGHGEIIIKTAKKFDINAYGIEIDPVKCLISRFLIRLFKLNNKAKIINGDIFNEDLSNADVVYCYLLQKTNKKIMNKLKKDLRKDTKIISHYFSFPGWKIIKKDKRNHLYLYIAGESY